MWGVQDIDMQEQAGLPTTWCKRILDHYSTTKSAFGVSFDLSTGNHAIAIVGVVLSWFAVA